MTASHEDATDTRPVERFKPTSGLFVGYAGLLFVAVVLVYVILEVHTVTGLQVALGMLLFGLVVWVTQLRSRATAYPDRLLLRNSFRDVTIPLALIDDVSVRQTLNVWVGEQRFVCIGIGSSLRSMVKDSRRRSEGSALLGPSRWREFAGRAEQAAPDQSAMSYETFVVTRIQELVEQAKKESARRGGAAAAAPRRTLARLEIAAMGVTGLAFVASLLL